ncbi:unnamed protein product [Linum tenue]|uniref:DUF6817 domain-containing protein n=1 Tax=Linum tenue TaxID=586396 RepID=A0AAV0MFF4_9ROSI|nr:unnamed protein product [Linum tenue]
MLKLWGSPEAVCRCGLFHSTYSNAYVSLALFPHTESSRAQLRAHLGPDAERLVHFFCSVPRQKLVFGRILMGYDSAGQIVEHLAASQLSLRNARERIVVDGGGESEAWREKLNSIVPEGGVTVENIKTGEEFTLPRRIVALLLLFTLADFADELFSFQDELYENLDGRLDFSGNSATPLWPGAGKPGLWVNLISRIAAIYNLLVREEEIFMEERRRSGGISVDKERDEDIELVVPPIFNGCTKIVDAGDQIIARDTYWEAVCGNASQNNDCNDDKLDKVEELLVKSLEKNPFLGDPHLVLAQVYLAKGRFEAAEVAAEKGLKLLLEWGTAWDKRVSWEGWVAWGRVLVMKAKEKSWPKTSWGIRSLRLIR